MPNPPSGTVTFLFTDIEGSTRHWEEQPEAMSAALARHDAILRQAIEAYSGFVFKTVGDAFCAAFPTPHYALAAALNIQRMLISEDWPTQVGQVKVRVALHTGVTEEREGDYFGQPVNRVARLLAAGHGGQVLLSLSTQELVRDNLPSGVSLADLGEHRLKDLIRPEHIFQLQAHHLPAEFPPLKTLDNRPNNLPFQPTPLIGREKELADIAALLHKPDVRLVTLTGPGGTGKTRLSLQAGADILDYYPDGVWFVELAALVEPKLVVSTIAATLGVKEAGGTPIIDTLKEHLKNRHMLLVLDNFEQVVSASPDVSKLIAAGGGMKILVTSRIPLHIRGEYEYAVPPLSLPDPKHLPPVERLTQYEAVRLFIERATAVKADFEITNSNAPAVAEICVRLDGLPLAIELAAARVKMLPPHVLLTRLSQRLKMLTGGARDLSARQQTLRGAIDWSYDLLDEGEKQLFSRMAVFQGGRTLEALEAVCNYDGQLQLDVFDGVQSLLDKSLLQQREGSDGEPRFWMLETIHEYANEKLVESEEVDELSRQHAEYFVIFAEKAEARSKEAEQRKALDSLEDEADNLRAALTWAREAGDVELGLRLVGALAPYWTVRGHFTEGLDQAAPFMSQIDTVDAPTVRAKALFGIGEVVNRQGNLPLARDYLERSLALYRSLDDKKGAAAALRLLGTILRDLGDHQSTRAYAEESLALFQELGDSWGVAKVLMNLGQIVLFIEHDYERASAFFEQSIGTLTSLGATEDVADNLFYLALIAFHHHQHVRATEQWQQSMFLYQSVKSKPGVVWCLLGFGCIAGAQGYGVRAAQLGGTVEALFEELSMQMDSQDTELLEYIVTSAVSQLGHDAFDRAWQEGRAMTLEQALEYALRDPSID